MKFNWTTLNYFTQNKIKIKNKKEKNYGKKKFNEFRKL